MDVPDQMKVLSYGVSQISWELLLAGLRRVQSGQRDDCPHYSLDAKPNIVLACTALEAFSNEFSLCASTALTEARQQAFFSPEQNVDGILGCPAVACETLANIVEDRQPNMLERYKGVCSALDLGLPSQWDALTALAGMRNDLVHFRNCRLSIVEQGGHIHSLQEIPAHVRKLRRLRVGGWAIVSQEHNPYEKGRASDVEWVNIIATGAMAVWVIQAVLAAVLHVLEGLPDGMLRQYAVQMYACADRTFHTVFHWGSAMAMEEEAALSARRS